MSSQFLYDQQSIQQLRGLAERQKPVEGTSSSKAEIPETGPDAPVKPVYTPLDVATLRYGEDLGPPGEHPFTRGVHATGYRGRLWTMRMFSGFGAAEETNARFKYLLQHGETGLSVAFDYPTLIGYDTDAPQAIGEFGKCGVAISSLRDMELLFEGIDQGEISTSMTINGPAAIIWAMYIVAAGKKGTPMSRLGGTIQNDILKEYISQASYIYPPKPSLRLVADTVEFGTKFLPLWNTISISGYHIREAGATAQQELAFTLADGLTYVKLGMERGLDVDAFAPRLSFFFNCHNDLFEEMAKFRAARRIWAREMKERFRAKNERSCWLRFHTQTSGCTLTEQQVENNIVRTTIQALAAVLGGTQSLHTNSMDEALALPSERAVRIALRTQQIIAHESGVASSIDPLGGSFMVEALTDQMEESTHRYFDKIESLGGVIPAIERGFFQKEIADSAYRYQRDIETKTRMIVGVNCYVADEELNIPILREVTAGKQRQVDRLNQVRRERDNREVRHCLQELERAAQGYDNLMPFILDAVRAYATLGEMCDVLRGVFGEYTELVVT